MPVRCTARTIQYTIQQPCSHARDRLTATRQPSGERPKVIQLRGRAWIHRRPSGGRGAPDLSRRAPACAGPVRQSHSALASSSEMRSSAIGSRATTGPSSPRGCMRLRIRGDADARADACAPSWRYWRVRMAAEVAAAGAAAPAGGALRSRRAGGALRSRCLSPRRSRSAFTPEVARASAASEALRPRRASRRARCGLALGGALRSGGALRWVRGGAATKVERGGKGGSGQ